MQEHWASFWEHVDELRQTLLRSILIVGVGFLIVLGFYQPLLHLLIDQSTEQSDTGLLQQRAQRLHLTNQTSREQVFELPSQAWLISNQISSSQKDGQRYYHLAPGESLLYEQVIPSNFLILGPIEGVVLVFKLCFWLSLALTAPLWGWVWLQFILPGLKSQERVMLVPFLGCSLLCLCLGMAFAYFFTLPLANQSLRIFNNSIGQNAWTLTYYVNYALLLFLGHAIAAELGLLLLLLVHFRLLSPDWLIAKRRYMSVLAFILGALLTPPDIFTQLLLAIPLIGLYEIAIYYAKWRYRKTFYLSNCLKND